MAIDLKISPDSAIVQAAETMVAAHLTNETMWSAIYEVQDDFPDLSDEQGILLWIGVNASHRKLGGA